ncbi:MAG: hypothetical protein GXY54_01415 [Deltaproteobacteria bacterium]|nr:hypothetical protein [Deltaproteobacteria bacterium]
MPRKVTKISVVQEEEVLVDEVSRIDEELKIMEEHPDSLEASEESIQEEMKKRDREYKDEHLHSIPKPRKHTR